MSNTTIKLADVVRTNGRDKDGTLTLSVPVEFEELFLEKLVNMRGVTP